MQERSVGFTLLQEISFPLVELHGTEMSLWVKKLRIVLKHKPLTQELRPLAHSVGTYLRNSSQRCLQVGLMQRQHLNVGTEAESKVRKY